MKLLLERLELGELLRSRPLHRLAVAAVALAVGCVLAAAAWRSDLTAPPPTLLLRDRHGEFLGEVGGALSGFGYWPLSRVPPRLAAATLAAEDRRFWDHPGVDARALGRALAQNLRHRRRVSGGSTLAMQVARMQHPGRRGYWRKGLEALTALFMTTRHGREAVLAHYLAIVPYGNRIHGVAYAARRYLDKPAEDLSWAESAFLAALPQAPGRMNPLDGSGRLRAIARGRRILSALRDHGSLNAAEYELAVTQIAALRIPAPARRPAAAMHAILRFEERWRDPAWRRKHARRPVVSTTLDLGLQRQVASLTYDAVERWEASGARNAAAVVVERGTNEVLAWIGSAEYFDDGRAGAIDYTRVPRSPGSALKPFIYALALERGAITPASILDDLERGAGGITNSDDLFLGPLLPRAALANSRNVPAANLLDRLGLGTGYAFLRDLGLHDGVEPAGRYGLGLAIGSLPVTLENLTRAYTALAADGRLSTFVWCAGDTLAPPERQLSEATARQVTQFLADPMARMPVFPRMGASEYPFPVAVKTGTSSRFRDAWTVAYSRRYVVGVWMGDPDFQPMNRLTGYRSAAELTRSILMRLHTGGPSTGGPSAGGRSAGGQNDADGLNDVGFPPPRGYRAERLCALTGALAGEACDRVVLEWFAAGEQPVDSCSVHIRLAVDTRSGLPATPRTEKRFVEVRTFTDLPPRYASWAAAAGLPRTPSAALEVLAAERGPQLGRDARLRVTSPESGSHLLRDPETPPANATVALSVVADPPVPQLVWYVDGNPFQVVDFPYAARWPLSPGAHTFQARLPYGGSASSLVRIVVQ